MSKTKQKRMTVEEFFDWQRRQDRNYELVDGVPVLATKLSSASAENTARLMDNLITVAPSGTRTLSDNGNVSLEWPDNDLSIMVVPSPERASFAFATAVFRSIFQGTGTFVLIDTEQPRVGIWRGAHSERRCSEVIGLDAVIDLPEIEATLPLAELYADLTFEPAP